MRKWLLATALATAALSFAPADAAAAERVDAIVASARAEIAAALYSASATQAAAERIADARLTEAQREIERLRGEGERARTQLVAAQEQYVRELEQRSSAYQEEIAVFRQTVTEIAETPQGRRALALYAEGDAAAGREVLTRLMETRARAERRAADLRQAADARRIAALDLDALKRGAAGLDTLTVIADFERVTRLDATHSNDWLELARLYRDAGRLEQAEEAVRRGLEAARTPAEIGRLQLERASIFSARLDTDAEMQAATEALAQLTLAAAAEPGVMSIQRDLLEARLRASSETDADLLAAVREAVARAPNDLSLQLTYIGTLTQLAEEAADREDYRAAIANLSVMMDAIDAVDATDAERIAVDNARARVLELGIAILERNGSIEQAMESRSLRLGILRDVRDANPASAAGREAYALALVDYGAAALRHDFTFATDAGETVDGSVFIQDGVRLLREAAAADPSNATTQLLFAGMLLSGGQEWLGAQPDSPEAQAMWTEGVAALQALAGAYPDRIFLQSATAGVMLMRIQEESDSATKRALMAELMPRIRELARRHGDDPNLQNVYLAALIEEANVAEPAQQASVRARVEREAEELVRRAARRAPDHPAGRLEVANLYRGLGSYYLGVNATPLALERYERAFAIQRTLWMADPEITAFRDELADDMIRLARKFYEEDDAANGALYWRRALDLYRNDVDTGEDAAWREAVLLTRLGAYGDFLVERQDWTGAQAVVEESLALRRNRIAASPDNVYARRLVAIELHQLGRLATEQDDLVRAEGRFAEALAAAQSVAADHPDDAADQIQVARTLDSLIDNAYRRRDSEGALRYLQSAVEVRRRLAAAPAATEDDRGRLADVVLQLGRMRERAGDLSSARTAFDEAVSIARRMAASSPASATAREVLDSALLNAASVRRSQNDYAGALPLLREQLAVRRQQAASGDDPLQRARGRYGMAHTFLSIALTEDDLNRPAQAAASYREMFAIYRQLIAEFPGEPQFRTELVNLMTRVESRDVLSADDRQWLAQARANQAQGQSQ